MMFMTSTRSSLVLARRITQHVPQTVTVQVRSWQINISGSGKDDNNYDNKRKHGRRHRDSKVIRGQQAYRFVDRIRLRAIGGTGGNGCNSSASMGGSSYKKRSDGGNGGNGGMVVVVADSRIQSLRQSRPVFYGQAGTHGSSNHKMGRSGKNTIIRVPRGVVVRRVLDHGEEWDEENQMLIKPEVLDDDDYHDDVWENATGKARQFEDIDFDDDLKEEDIDDEEEEEQQQQAKDHRKKKHYIKVEEDEEEDYDDDEDDDDDDDYSTGMISIDCEPGVKRISPHNLPDDMDDQLLQEFDNDGQHFTSDDDDDTKRERVLLADLDKAGSHVVVARGGQGGKGNGLYGSRFGAQPDPHFLSARATPEPGEIVHLELELKMLADIGLVGFPNAGKSSLLAAMSRATPEIAPYPFTTLHPLIGVVEYRDGLQVVAADIPGLVAGASEGRGRGHGFLRHIERTKTLIYIVDSAGTDGRSPVEDLEVLVNELANYEDGHLVERPAIVVANKLDLLSDEQTQRLLTELRQVATDADINFSGEVMGISAGKTGQGLGPLSKAMRYMVHEMVPENVVEDKEYAF